MGMNCWRIHLSDEANSEAFGEQLGGLLQAGDCVGLVGELGSGKTTLCRGIGRGLECVSPLRSPTYLLCHEVEGRVPVLHLDAYFEQRMDSLLEEGLCERFDANHVVLVEWADHLHPWWPSDRLELRLQVEEKGRMLEVRGCGSRSDRLLQQLKESWIAGQIP